MIMKYPILIILILGLLSLVVGGTIVLLKKLKTTKYNIYLPSIIMFMIGLFILISSYIPIDFYLDLWTFVSIVIMSVAAFPYWHLIGLGIMILSLIVEILIFLRKKNHTKIDSNML